jgi:hypothetical protein
MRKLIWCGVAAMAVLAVCVAMTAHYAVQHSDTWAARCVHMAWCVTVDWNPVVQVGRMIGTQSAHMMQPAKPDCCVQATVPCTPADPDAEQSLPPVIDVIDLGTLQGLNVQIDQEPMTEPAQAAEMVPPGAIEESEPQQEMAPADEDADKAATGEGNVNYWLGLFRDGGEEPAQIEQIPMPKEDGDATFPIPIYSTSPTEQDDDAELLPMPHEEEATDGALKQTGATEESDKPGAAADGKEDPNACHRYPGCPYNGACSKPQAAPEDKEPGKAEVDTMEFRSTDDAKPGEFDPKPME